MSHRISLNQQIQAAQREVALRQSVYPGQVARGKMRQAEADFHIETMGAVQRTLEWLADHERVIKQRLSEGPCVTG